MAGFCMSFLCSASHALTAHIPSTPAACCMGWHVCHSCALLTSFCGKTRWEAGKDRNMLPHAMPYSFLSISSVLVLLIHMPLVCHFPSSLLCLDHTLWPSLNTCCLLPCPHLVACMFLPFLIIPVLRHLSHKPFHASFTWHEKEKENRQKKGGWGLYYALPPLLYQLP